MLVVSGRSGSAYEVVLNIFHVAYVWAVVGVFSTGVVHREVSQEVPPPSLPPSPFLFPLILCRGLWLVFGEMPAMGALFKLGAGCQTWKPLDIPGTQHPGDAVVNGRH